MKKLPSVRVMIAFAIAAIADFLQITFWPVTIEGVASPISDLLDIVVGACMIALLGWHWAFLPSFIGKLIPGADLIPFWTGAVFLVGMGEQTAGDGTPGQQPQQHQMGPLGQMGAIGGPMGQQILPGVQFPGPGVVPHGPESYGSSGNAPANGNDFQWIKP